MPSAGDLDAAERLCLELAWTAFCSGTVPVGAVLLDADGAVLATGRSRMYEASAPPPELANSLLAHAEVNALVHLTPERRYQDHRLVTSLEPCPLCTGALAMSTVGRLTHLGADPYGGAVGALAPTPHTARVPVVVDGPRDDAWGVLASALHVAFYLRRNPGGHVVRVHRERRPDLLAAAGTLVDAGLFELADAGRPWAEATRPLLAALAPRPPRPPLASVRAMDDFDPTAATRGFLQWAQELGATTLGEAAELLDAFASSNDVPEVLGQDDTVDDVRADLEYGLSAAGPDVDLETLV